MFDPSTLPISGGIIPAVALYALVSLFVTGPVVGERTIAKSGWDSQCTRAIAKGIEQIRPTEPVMPKLDCQSLIAPWFGSEGSAWCSRYGGEIRIPFADVIDAQQRKAKELNEARFDYAASKATSRCTCAVTTTLEDKRVQLALYAGSFRLITPPSVRNLSAELQGALGNPHCAMKE